MIKVVSNISAFRAFADAASSCCFAWGLSEGIMLENALNKDNYANIRLDVSGKICSQQQGSGFPLRLDRLLGLIIITK